MNTQIKATKYIAYLRKSTDDKEKQMLSLESQAEVIKNLAEKFGVTIVETIQEKLSAKKPGRPGFNKMMDMIGKGKADGIITWQISRLSRNMKDSGEMMYFFDTDLLRSVITEQQNYSKDSMEQFMFGLQSLTAKLENDRTAYNVKVGMTTCARKGIYPGCPPLGYLADRGGIKGARKREIDPLRFPVIRKMWDLMLTGTLTPYQILKRATDEWGLRNRNGQKLSKAQIYNIFNNRFYYGEFEWPKRSGVVYEGVHPPMVSKDEFMRVQKMIGKTGRARPIRRYFPYGGCILHCGECECAITGYAKTKKQKNGNVHHYTYYGCTKKKEACDQKVVKEAELERQIIAILFHIRIPDSIHELMMDWVRSENEKQFAAIYAQNELNKQNYDLVLKKISGLIDMRASGLITDGEFQERKIDAEKEKDRLAELIKATDRNVTNWLDTADKLFTFTGLAFKRFRKGDPETRRAILASLGWNLQIKDKELDISREEWIEPVKQMATAIREKFDALEPLETLQNKKTLEDFFQSRLVCAGEDLNFHSLAAATTSR